MSEVAPTLYNLCLNVAVAESQAIRKFYDKEFRILPNNVLFDFYHKVIILCAYKHALL